MSSLFDGLPAFNAAESERRRDAALNLLRARRADLVREWRCEQGPP